MTVTVVQDASVGGALTATASASAALAALAAASLPEVAARLSGYMGLMIPSPSFGIAAQIATAGSALVSATAEVAGIPGVGVTLAAALTAGVAAQQAAQLAIKAADGDIALKVDAALAGLASLNVQVSAGASGPNVNLTLVAKVIAELELLKAAIEAQASLAASISASLEATGLVLYRFDGDISVAGGELQAQINANGITGQVHFMVLLPRNPGAWAALQATMRTG